MIRLLIVVGTAVLAASTGWFVRRKSESAPTQVGGMHPTQLDRSDFTDPRDWLAVAFTAASCNTCADVEAKLRVLESRHVGVHIVEYSAHKELHRKYAIDSVPCIVIADQAGVVRSGMIGPVSATDLWAAMARTRDGVDIDHCSDDQRHR
jgi:hypothetical protein